MGERQGQNPLPNAELGLALGITKLEDFLHLCETLKIGVIKVPVMEQNRIKVEVYECVTCSGMKPVGVVWARCSVPAITAA